MAKKPNEDQPAAAAQPKTTRQRKPHPVILLRSAGGGESLWRQDPAAYGSEAGARQQLRRRGEAGTYRIVRLLADVTVRSEQVTKVTLE